MYDSIFIPIITTNVLQLGNSFHSNTNCAFQTNTGQAIPTICGANTGQHSKFFSNENVVFFKPEQTLENEFNFKG